MTGTFRFGDALLAVPVPTSKFHSGDVIVFAPMKSDTGTRAIVAHRVIACMEEGIVTQGDACASPDPVLVHPSQVIGRVTRVQRGGKSYVVWNGWAGRAWARHVRFRGRLLALMRAPYRWLRTGGIVRRLWHPPVTRVVLATTQGATVKYLRAGKTVAVWQPETGAYWCRKPYDLVLERPATTDR